MLPPETGFNLLPWATVFMVTAFLAWAGNWILAKLERKRS